VAVSADGRTAVSGGSLFDTTVRVWDLAEVRVWDLAGAAAPRVLTGHDGPVRAVAVSADGRTAVSGGRDSAVRVWDLAGAAAPRVLSGHNGPVEGVAVSADGRTAVSGGHDRTVRVWDLADDREHVRWIADAGVSAVAFSTAVTVAGDAAGQVHALKLTVPAAAST